MMARVWAAPLVALVLACGPPPPDDPVDGVEPVDPPEVTPGPLPIDTDPAGGATPTADTAPASPPPPASLGGTFHDVTASLWGSGAWVVSEPPLEPGWTHARPDFSLAFVGDLLGDGRLEFIASSVHASTGRPPHGRVSVFAFDPVQGTLIHDLALSQLVGAGSPSGISGLVDVDDDGDLDLVRGDRQRIIGLVDGGQLSWAADVSWSTERTFAFTPVAVADLDQDGWLDLVLKSSGCGQGSEPTPALIGAFRTGLQAWTVREDAVPNDPAAQPRAAALLPLGPQGAPQLAVVATACEHLTPPTGILASMMRDVDGYPTWMPTDPFPSNALFKQDPTSPASAITLRAPMALTVVDLDADSVLDQVWSLSDTRVHVFRGDGMGGVEDRTARAGAWLPDGPVGTVQLPWGVVPLDLDADGRPDLVVGTGDDYASTFAPTWNGPYPVLSFWSDGAGGFADISDRVGIDLQANWRALMLTDVDGDADPDLLAGGQDTLPRIYRNDTAGRHLSLRLHGHTSNHLGMGATVLVEAPGLPPQLRVVGGTVTPDQIDDGRLFFGMGAAPVAARVTVHWPSGVVQELTDMAAGVPHVVEEPPLITLSVAGRRLPADGTSTVEIVVTPRDPAGVLRHAVVTIEAPWGDAVFTASALAEGQVWRRTLVAPTEPGSTVIEVTVDGAVVPIHPRVWWDAVTP